MFVAVQVSISRLDGDWARSLAADAALPTANLARLGRLCRVVRNFPLPLLPREPYLLNAAGRFVARLVTAAAADHRDFLFEGREPIGQVEPGAGGFAGQARDFLL